jgi:DNA-binding response OmpR family regulator
MLLEREGELVTRDELQNRLWPNNTIVEFDHSINAAMKRLRQALGETADTPVRARRQHLSPPPTVKSITSLARAAHWAR